MYQILSELLVKTSGLDLSENKYPARPEENSVKTLMLLHGWGMNSQVWEPIREVLESQYHILWVDLPGHGFNRHCKAENLEQIVRLIAEVTPDNTHLMGWSLGGMVAQALEQKIPDKIQSMTLVTSTPRFSQVVSDNVDSDSDDPDSSNSDWPHAMSDEVLNRFADNLKQDTEKTLKGFIALQFIGVKNSKQAQNILIDHILFDGNSLIDKTIDVIEDINEEINRSKKWGGVLRQAQQPIGQAQHDLLDNLNKTVSLGEHSVLSNIEETRPSNIPTTEALDVGLSILKQADLRKAMPSCPQHWVFSEYDRLIPKEVINDLISLRPDAEITLLEKAGHAPFITHTEAFLKHINRFIDAQP